jgi:hypothetical protein
MDYYKIKAEAEAIRDASGLPAEYYPVLITIKDEPVAGTGYYGTKPMQYAPHCRIMLGREYHEPYLEQLPEAMSSFRLRVLTEAHRAKWEARRHAIQARWNARRAAMQPWELI